jgi:hypothetical protein
MTAEACCKMGRLISEYDLTPPALVAGNLDSYLEVRWKGLGQHEPVGFRQLAEWFNKLLLRAIYSEHGREVLDTNLNAEYDTLTSSETDVGERAELISDLKEDGIDGEAVTDEFVSKSTVRRHLKNCLNAGEKRTESAGHGNWVGDRVQMSRDQFQKYLQTPLNHLDRSGRLPGASDADLSTPIILTCPHCPTRARLTEALERGYICEDHFGRADNADAETDADRVAEPPALEKDDRVLRPPDSMPVNEAWQAFVS